jgi:hypothetical protein
LLEFGSERACASPALSATRTHITPLGDATLARPEPRARRAPAPASVFRPPPKSELTRPKSAEGSNSDHGCRPGVLAAKSRNLVLPDPLSRSLVLVCALSRCLRINITVHKKVMFVVVVADFSAGRARSAARRVTLVHLGAVVVDAPSPFGALWCGCCRRPLTIEHPP